MKSKPKFDFKKLFKGKETESEELKEGRAIKSGKMTPEQYAKGEKMEKAKKAKPKAKGYKADGTVRMAKGGKVKRYAEGGMRGGMGGIAQTIQAQMGQARPMSKMAPPPSNTAQQDARMQARTAALQGRGVGQKQIDATQQRMQGRFDARNAARGMGGRATLPGGPTVPPPARSNMMAKGGGVKSKGKSQGKSVSMKKKYI